MRFFNFVERQFDRKIKCLRSDQGGEFTSARLEDWLSRQGVEHNLSVPYTPQQNGKAERYNRTLCDRARSLLFGAGLPVQFWEYALHYAAYCTNRVPTAGNKGHCVPYTALSGRPPSLARAKVFGCLAQVWVGPKARHKFSKHARWGVFLGVPSLSKG